MLHQDGKEHQLFMAKEIKIDPGRDYDLAIALKPRAMPEGAARVRVLIDESAWYGRKTGRIDVVETGGTHDWKTYTVPLPVSALGDARKLTIFVYHDKPEEGALGIDALSLKPRPAGATVSSSRAASGSGTLKAVNYTADNPVVLFAQNDARIAIRTTPDETLYRADALPEVAVEAKAVPGATLVYRVRDGFGQVLERKTTAADRAVTVGVALPPGHGYYEVVATLEKDGQTLAESRRSIGALTPPPAPVGDEPFGMWIQGRRHYPELGVRWAREGVWWRSYKAQEESYLRKRVELFRWYRDNHIRVIAYPKHPHPHQTSREVIKDTPEAWRALAEWWTKMVRALAGHVDAWGVINEPMRGAWKGSDELIIRYWALMRRIVDRYDPGTPLLGPSLSPNERRYVKQYEKLLDMGFGKYIDAIEMHTYIDNPEEDDWKGKSERVLDMTRRATGKDIPLWSTEHGSSATYRNELRQAQHLTRSWLEAKRIGYPVVIWHMFSHPQGTNKREIRFSIFRNIAKGDAPPQPRPAGLAYGVMTRQLAGAEFVTRLDDLGPAVHAYVFKRGGKAMLALWTTGQKTRDVSLPVGDDAQVTVTGLFGRIEPLAVRNGRIRVTVDRNPRFVAPLPASYLRR
ncbi:MAG: hypothetical protein WD407_11710 [Rhodospirillales bacterium]